MNIKIENNTRGILFFKMIILAFGDIHIKPDNATSIDILQRKVLKKIEEIKPNFVVILGDVLDTHERILSNCLNRAQDFFKSIKEKTELIVLVGNHDQYNNKQFLTESHWMNAMKEWKGKITIVDKVILKKTNDNIFTFCPYVEAGRFEEALNTIGNEWKKSTLIFAHQEFKGSVMNGTKSMYGDVWKRNYPPIVSGHIHLNQEIENIYYPGSILQTSFGEKCSNVLLRIDIENNQTSYTEIVLNLPRQETLELSLSEIDNYDIEDKISDRISKLRLVLVGTPEEFAIFKSTSRYKELIKKGIKIVPSITSSTKKIVKTKDKDFLCTLQELIKDDEDLKEIYKTIIAKT